MAAAARELGDAVRGAIVFYQPYLTCTKWHVSDEADEQLGPDLGKMGKDVTDAYLVESILNPSKDIKEGYESVTILTADFSPVRRGGVQEWPRPAQHVPDADQRIWHDGAANLDGSQAKI